MKLNCPCPAVCNHSFQRLWVRGCEATSAPTSACAAIAQSVESEFPCPRLACGRLSNLTIVMMTITDGLRPESKKLRPTLRSFFCESKLLEAYAPTVRRKTSKPTPRATPDAEECPERPTPRRYYPSRRTLQRPTSYKQGPVTNVS